MEKIEVTLQKDKETKRTIRFASDEEGAPVGTLYVSKEAFNGSVPQSITLVVEAA